AQIMRLVGTTKSTIDSVRDNNHWNAANLTAMDPVTLGLCSQIELDLEVKRASKDAAVQQTDVAEGTTLLTAEEALARATARTNHDISFDDEGGEHHHRPAPNNEEFDADSVFSKLKSLKSDADE